LVRTIVNHFLIRPFERDHGKEFIEFEYADSLVAPEERTMIAPRTTMRITDGGMAGLPGSGA
jgi:hypothetical protein